MKKQFALVSVWSLFALLSSHLAFADVCSVDASKGCHKSSSQCQMKGDKNCGGEKSQCPVTEKFMKKACFFLSNQKEIGLSEQQVSQIKDMKLQMKKACIQQGAAMQVFQLDIESKLSQPQVDVAGINQMIDSGMAGMAQSAKASVQALADLKAVLTEEQMAKAKEIWQKKS